MAETASKRKSGRTPEQQAARDARKAAKRAAELAQAAEQTAPEAETESTEAGEKRKRPVYDEGELLEVDLSAGVPLSKAELRAAKKRAKRGEEPVAKKAEYEKKAKAIDNEAEGEEDDAEAGAGQKTGSSKAKAKPQEKGEFSVWVGNMSFRTTSDGLKKFIEDGVVELGGEPDSITRVYLPRKAGRGEFSENKGFAYCDFKTESQMLLALGLSERNYDGRRLLIKLGNDHRANPNARTPKVMPSGPDAVRLGKQQHAESSTLFIGNLPFDVTEEELRDLVEGNSEQLGAVKDEKAQGGDDEGEGEGGGEGEGEGDEEEDEEKIKEELTKGSRGGARAGLIKTRVAQFEDTGRCKGFAFWDFKSPAHARAALLNRKNHFLRGVKLTLQYASQEATKRAGGKRKREGKDERAAKKRAAAPRYFESGRDEAGESYEDSSRPQRAAQPAHTDFKSEAAAQSRIAAMVSGGAGDDDGASEPPREKRDKRGKKWESSGRPRPGAALAMAKREKVGIVQSAGAKITFD